VITKDLIKELGRLQTENAELKAELHKLQLGAVKLYRNYWYPILTDKVEKK